MLLCISRSTFMQLKGRFRFWIVISALVVVFFSATSWILSRIASPPVTTIVTRPPWDWRTVVSTEERFSITFPNKPKVQTQTTTNRAGVMFVRQYHSEVDRMTAFGISVTDLPVTNQFSEEQVQIMLDAGRNEALGTDGKLLDERKITLGQNLGREFDMEKLGGTAFVRVRVYFVEGRIYTLTAVGSSRENALKKASEFLDSFRLRLSESSTNK